MTGFTMTYDRLIEQYNMISSRKKKNCGVSQQNQEVLNRIFNELILSLASPLLEFADVLLEKVMYPVGGQGDADGKKTFKESVYLLGNSVFMEIIHLRAVCKKLMVNAGEYDGSRAGFDRAEYIPRNLRYLQNLHILLIHVLQRLSDLMENSSLFQRYFKKIIVGAIEDFNKNFQSFKLLDQILSNLFDMVMHTGNSDTEIFTITDGVMEDIKHYTNFNKKWYIELLTHSDAFKTFMSKQTIQLAAEDLGKIVTEQKFQDYLTARKVKLNISTRRVF